MTDLLTLLKKKPKMLLLLLLFLGVLLIVLSYLLPKQEQSETEIARTRSETEKRLSQVLSEIEGAGEVEVLVTDGEEGSIGAVIVAEGGEDLMVQSNLVRACCAALKLPAQAVEVFVKETKE